VSVRCLNLGCGRRIHPDWENIDFTATAPGVRACDLRKGIPYPDASFDVIYHSHLLEHFSKQSAPVFLRECHRVLKLGGVLRVAVPDLERVVREYLKALESASHGHPEGAASYDWMVLEMYDQAVREQSGGSCADFFRQEPIPNWDFIHKRVGAEANAALAAVRAQSVLSSAGGQRVSLKWKFVLRNLGSVLRNKLARIALSKEDYAALQVGRFRRQGEIHQWMYDSYSLARLLTEAGFADPQPRAATQSRIPNWLSYCLDNEADGSTYKPDSLFMEAVKP
jgi:SAM-dependent methyltransferase